MHLYRPNAPHPFDPFKPEPSDDGHWAALIGDKPERRYVLIAEQMRDALVIADPAGAGLTSMKPEQFFAAWKAAARNAISWAGCLWVDRARAKVRHWPVRVSAFPSRA